MTYSQFLRKVAQAVSESYRSNGLCNFLSPYFEEKMILNEGAQAVYFSRLQDAIEKELNRDGKRSVYLTDPYVNLLCPEAKPAWMQVETYRALLSRRFDVEYIEAKKHMRVQWLNYLAAKAEAEEIAGE